MCYSIRTAPQCNHCGWAIVCCVQKSPGPTCTPTSQPIGSSPVICPACVNECADNRGPDLPSVESWGSEEWLGMSQQEQPAAFDGDSFTGPTPVGMDFAMTSDTSAGFGMLDRGTDKTLQHFTEQATSDKHEQRFAEIVQPPTLPFDISSGSQISMHFPTMPQTSQTSNSHLLVTPSSISTNPYGPPSSTPTTATTFTFTVSHPAGVMSISTPQPAPISAIPPALTDPSAPEAHPVPQGPPPTQAPSIQPVKRGKGRRRKETRSRRGARSVGT